MTLFNVDVRVFLHGRVIEQHIALELDPLQALPGLTVGNPAKVRPQLSADGAKDGLGIG